MAKDEVRDGFLGDLPEDIRTKVMYIHKMIVDACNTEIKRSTYDDIRNLPWAKEMLNEFLREPKDKDLCGSVRVYKKGKRYSCMIQVTGHPMNSRNTENEELFHGFIRNTHTSLKGKVRKQFDVTLTCESEHGENFEGFDIWTKPKVAAELWEKFSDKKTKIDKEYKESTSGPSYSYLIAEIDELPMGLQTKLYEYVDYFEDVMMEKKTQSQYRIDAFKKRFNFVPEKDSHGHNNPNRGTITINGKQVKVNLNDRETDSFASANTGDLAYNPTKGLWTLHPANSKMDTITLNPNRFFKLKKEDQDAVLNHELGHLTMHNIAKNSNVLDKRFISKGLILNRLYQAAISEDMPSSRAKHFALEMMKKEWVQSLLGQKINDSNLEFLRDTAKRAVRKYIRGHENEHLTSDEAEADAYSKQHGHNISKSLYHTDKIMRKELPKTFKKARYTDSKIRDTMKWYNKTSHDEYKVRKRMLADKDIGGNPIYKESLEALHMNECSEVVIRFDGNSIYEGCIYIGSSDMDKESLRFLEEYAEAVHYDDPTKYVFVEEAEDGLDVYIGLESTYTERLYNYLTTKDTDSQIYHEFTSDDMEENINESRTPHHTDIKFCYRVGIDAKTGHEVAVQFELVPDNISQVSDAELIATTERRMKKLKYDLRNSNDPKLDAVAGKLNTGEGSSHEKALEKIKNTIRKLGHVDFKGSEMFVRKIFTREGSSLNTVNLVGIMSSVVDSTLKALGLTEKEFEKGYADPRFSSVFLSKVNPSLAEKYTVNEKCIPKNDPQYLSTRLIWDRELHRKLRYTNAIRPKPVDIRAARGEHPFDMSDFLKNNYVNPYKKNPKLEFFIDPNIDGGIDLSNIYQESANDADYFSHQYRGVGLYSPMDIFILNFSEYLNEGVTQFTYTDKLFENPDCEDIFEELEYFAHFKEPRKRLDLMNEMLLNIVKKECGIMDIEYVFEASKEPDNIPETSTNMTPTAAKKTLGSATLTVIQNQKVNQYTADIFSNIITKNLLGSWVQGYHKLSITLDPKLKGSIFEFKIPNLTLDFISRFVEGREPINGFLHRIPEIKIRMSEDAFKTMKNKDDAFNFFRAAVKYYDVGIANYSEKIMTEIMKLSSEMKRLISTTKLSGLVSLPIQMLFSFDNVDMSSTKTFNISKEDMTAIIKFIRGIYSNYASPEKEKQKIIQDLKNIVYHLKESCELGDNKISITSIIEGVNDFYSGKFDTQLMKYSAEFEYNNIDMVAMANAHHELKVMYEQTKMKKLKKIPRDLVAYITIETESIKDANDKMMIASYCLSKLEIVEWYIELLEVGSKKYIVPHSKPYLETVHRQLLQCYDNIMKVKIVRPNERPLIDIPWPKNYEG